MAIRCRNIFLSQGAENAETGETNAVKCQLDGTVGKVGMLTTNSLYWCSDGSGNIIVIDAATLLI